MTISGIFTDTFKLYRRLFIRSLLVAVLIFAPISLLGALPELGAKHANLGLLLFFLSTILTFVGTLLVQGALAHAVEDVHADRSESSVGALYERTRGRLGSLVGASILAGVGIGLASLLLVIPGLVLWTRWSLLVPVIVLEQRAATEAFGRSRELVRGNGWRIFWLLVILFVLTTVVRGLAGQTFAFLPAFPRAWLGALVAQAVITPFQAHTLTALYYRLLEPDQPVVPERPKRWHSVWEDEERSQTS